MTSTPLAAVLHGEFPAWMRERGARYYLGGRVAIVEELPGFVEARVVGTDVYVVSLNWEEDDPESTWGDCTCPAFDRDLACKHLWALVLATDARAQSRLGKRAVRRRTESVESTWRDRVRAIGILRRHDAPRPASAQSEAVVHYVVDVERSIAGGAPLVRALQRVRKKSGEWGIRRAFPPTVANVAKAADAEDRRLLALLAPFPRPPGRTYYANAETDCERVIERDAALDLLPRLAKTGRLFWTTAQREGALVWDSGAPWSLRIDVDLEEQESVVTGSLERPAAGGGEPERLPLTEPLALFELGLAILPGALARFEPRGAMAWCVGLRRGGPIRAPRADAVALLAAVLDHAGAAVGPIPVPGEAQSFEIAGITVVDVAPEKRAHLDKPSQRGPVDCRVSFGYGGVWITSLDERRFVRTENGESCVRRDLRAESVALTRLAELGLRSTSTDPFHDRAGTLASTRVSRFVRTLIAEGWGVEAEGKLHRAASTTSVSVRSGIDWFELSGTVEFGDQRAAFPELLAAARAKRDTVVLGDGSFGVLPERWLERWGLLGLAGKSKGDAVRVPRAQGWLLDALLAARGDSHAEVDAGFAGYRERLARFAGVEPAHEPTRFGGELREYQRAGLGWLAFLREMGLGGCLADDMGLGKTVQVLAHLLAVRVREKRERRPSLVVAPRSLVFNWIDEARRFAPELETFDYTGTDRAARLGAAKGVDLVVTTYGTLRRDAAELAERRFDTVVLDEAQAIKNPASLSSKAARLLQADHRLALSGTPVENHLGELWSLFEFLNPGMLGRGKAFRDWVGRGAGNGSGDLDELGRALRPFFLRRTKQEVLDDLPEKTEQVIVCRLERADRRRYDELRAHYRAALLKKGDAEIERGQMHVLEALLRLRQCACHPGLLDPARRGDGSAKVDTLMARLEELVAEGHKALVFSQFTTLLGIVRDRLDAAGTAYAYLDGRTRNRKEKVERFQADRACPIFLVSLKAGGHGLNLTAADYVFLLDPWWNPAVESQAIDRAHRIGRTRPVNAYRLIAADTVEERIQELQADKRALAEAIFAERGGGAITRTELERLLA
jgi:superfamily II DNA or RNA helicase